MITLGLCAIVLPLLLLSTPRHCLAWCTPFMSLSLWTQFLVHFKIVAIFNRFFKKKQYLRFICAHGASKIVAINHQQAQFRIHSHTHTQPTYQAHKQTMSLLVFERVAACVLVSVCALS